MGTQQVELQLTQLFRGDPHVRQGAESRVDAIDDVAARNDLLHKAPRRLDPATRLCRESDHSAIGDGLHLFERKRCAVKGDLETVGIRHHV